MLGHLNLNSFTSKHCSLHHPVLDNNLAIVHNESPVAREARFKFEHDWQARTKELLFYDCYCGEIVEYGFPVFYEWILPHRLETYNKKCHQNFECFCGQYSPSAPVYANIYMVQEGGVGVTYASCHTCGLSVCFNDKYFTAEKETIYPGFHKDSEIMPIPSRPEIMPREVIPPRTRGFRPGPRELAASLGFRHGSDYHRTHSSIGHAVTNPKRLSMPATFGQLFDESLPSASSLLDCYLGKGKAATLNRFESPIPGPSRLSSNHDSSNSSCTIATLNRSSSPIPGPSRLSNNHDSSNSSCTMKEDNDVLVYCLSCNMYHPLDHFCNGDLLSEL